jgi:hypothetical protein
MCTGSCTELTGSLLCSHPLYPTTAQMLTVCAPCRHPPHGPPPCPRFIGYAWVQLPTQPGVARLDVPVWAPLSERAPFKETLMGEDRQGGACMLPGCSLVCTAAVL